MNLWKVICHGNYPKLVENDLNVAEKEGYEYIFHNEVFIFMKKVIKEGNI